MTEVANVVRTVLAGECYRAKEVDTGRDVQPGDVCVVVSKKGDRVEWATGAMLDARSGRYTAEEDFLRAWERLPDGEGHLRKMREEALGELEAAWGASTGEDALSHMSLHVALPAEGVSGEALAPLLTDMMKARGSVAHVRNNVAKLQLDVKRRHADVRAILAMERARVDALLKAQLDSLAERAGGMQALVRRAEEAIWTINLYLGRDEEIVHVKKGAPAPKDSKISVRQRVLFADEECAVAADDGGIDAADIAAFDEWLRDPAHRRQVLPEAKGMVAFKPRRNKKNYGADNPAAMWATAQKDLANKKTYFLMANGENLYRVCTDLEVGETLVPTEEEVLGLFSEEVNGVRQKIYPGDKRYMAAVEASSDLRKHYLRVLLFLQGLIDRTAVFAPLPAPRLNLLDRNVYRDHLVFVRDAEKLLDTGRTPFKEWLRNVNKRLDVGHRIIGTFESTYGLRDYSERGRNDRLSPPSAAWPDSLVLHTLEGRRGKGFFFRYERTDEVYRQRGWKNRRKPSYGKSERRASCVVEVSDEFIIDFDEAEVADMEWYLADRTNRHAYEQMFPLLQKAIEVKRRELAEEVPFRDLLARQISVMHGVSVEEAAAVVPGLVSWWKTKNKTHRPLVAPGRRKVAEESDTKALSMIVDEFGRRAKLAESGTPELDEQAVVALRAEGGPDVLLVAKARNGTYLSLGASNGGDVFVTEVEWAYNGSRAVKISSKPWQTVEKKRLLSWTVLWKGERFEDWKVDARAADHLTDPERDQLLEDAIPVLRGRVAEVSHDHRGKERRSADLGTLCVTREGESFHVWFWSREGGAPRSPLTGEWRHPEISSSTVNWSKKKGVVTPITGYHMYRTEFDRRPSGDGERTWPWSREKIITQDWGLTKQLWDDVSGYMDALRVKEALEVVVTAVVDGAQEVESARKVQRLKEAFIREYEHEELWDDHRKTIRQSDQVASRSETLRKAVEFLVEEFHVGKGMSPVEVARAVDGITFGGLVRTARRAGWTATVEEGKVDGPYPDDVVFDMSERDRSEVARILRPSKPAQVTEGDDDDDEDEDDE